jgi:hypothetical protein
VSKRRTVLGIFKGLLEKDPSIISQAKEALVYHIKNDNLRRVLLMLWVGADMKGAVNPATDNVMELLDAASFCKNPQVVEYLLRFKPEVNALTKDGDTVIDSYFQSLGWDLDSIFMRSDPRPTIQSIELLAKRGAGWQPKERYRYSQLRKALCKADRRQALDILDKLLAAAAFGYDVLRELMSTRKIKELLASGYGNGDRI